MKIRCDFLKYAAGFGLHQSQSATHQATTVTFWMPSVGLRMAFAYLSCTAILSASVCPIYLMLILGVVTVASWRPSRVAAVGSPAGEEPQETVPLTLENVPEPRAGRDRLQRARGHS